MVATVILGMLCVHLLCFCVMFYLISTRLHGKKMGMEIFAIGNLFLGMAYILQLLDGVTSTNTLSIINHTLTLCAPVAYAIGAMHFFNRPVRPWLPLLAIAGLYTCAQLLVNWLGNPAARHALLAGTCALLFFGMCATLIHGMRSFAQDLRTEMLVFAVLIAGIASLNAAKCWLIVDGGLAALDMRSHFQTVFYIYMCFLGTVLPPSVVWLVLKRLTDELSGMASRDPLTGLLNRRGLVQGLETYFRSRMAKPAYLLMVDLDHFKSINDTHGHNVGDQVLSHIANLLQGCTREGDLTCRLGGEEFVVICLDTDAAGAMLLAERTRTAIASNPAPTGIPNQTIRCTATVGVSQGFASPRALDQIMMQADMALYRGKANGRNCVVRMETAASHSALPPKAPASLGIPSREYATEAN